ncbi:TPA: KTSC domain-containing protein [Burkholderia vietnamiensis]|nr:KTSC domain-containing protein [Burkholderia vietnamiensis]
MNTAPSIATTEIASSQLHSIGHDEATNTLAILFKNKAGEPTSLYHFANVDTETFAELRDAESIGSHFYKAIKAHPDRFPFTRIEG